MFKVLYLPLGNQQSTIDAFIESGVNLEVFDFLSFSEKNKDKNSLANEFLKIVKSFQPKLIHTQAQFTGLFNSATFKKAKEICPGVIITNWTGDCREKPDKSYIELSQGCDYSLISSTGQIPLYEKEGCKNLKYWQIGCDPKVHFPKNLNIFKYDISFIGNHYGTFPDSNIRKLAVNHIKSNFKDKAGVFGSGYGFKTSSIPMKESNDIYNDSVCALSISHFNTISHYFSDRLLYCLASGRPTISWHFPGYDDYFVDGKDIFIVKNVNEIDDIVNYCKNNPEKANEIGLNGWKKVFHEHTFASRISELYEICKL